MGENDICCIFNMAPHYRLPILSLMDKTLPCDFYFGDNVESNIKKFDYNLLVNFKQEVKNIRLFNTVLIWQSNIVSLVFKKQYKYFLITGQSNILSHLILALLARLLNKKVYLWMHGLKHDLTWKNKFLAYTLYFLSHKYLLYSDFSKKLMINKGFSSKKIICIYNSLNYDLQLRVRNKLKFTDVYKTIFNNDKPTIIYIGRIQKRKRIDLLIDALYMLQKQNTIVNLIIIGSDKENVNIAQMPYFSFLKNNICLFGPCYDEVKIGELIYNADICVSPGNIGLTALHSLMYGTPAITHDNFANQMPEFEIIERGITGDFFKENDSEDLARKIKRWTDRKKIKRDKIREYCYKKLDDKYNPNYQIGVLKRVFNKHCSLK